MSLVDDFLVLVGLDLICLLISICISVMNCLCGEFVGCIRRIDGLC